MFAASNTMQKLLRLTFLSSPLDHNFSGLNDISIMLDLEDEDVHESIDSIDLMTSRKKKCIQHAETVYND